MRPSSPSIRWAAVSRTDMMSLTTIFCSWLSAEIVRARERRGGRGPRLGRDLAVIADDAVDLGHGGEALRIGLGGASGDDDARLRPLALRLADRLARLALGLGGDRAGVDDDDVGEAGRGGVAANHLGLVGVEPAAEGEDVDAHGPHRTLGTAPAANSAGSNRPSNSYSTGPVISTWSSRSRHSIARSPPGSVTVTLRSVRLVRAPHTAAAQAAEPQARVSPAPRSQVRTIEVIARGHRRERNIGAVGKDRVIFQQRADLAQIVGIDVVDPEHGVRIAHADCRGGMQNRMIDRPDLQLDRPRIEELLGERDLVPSEARNAHVHGGDQRRGALGSR